MSRSGEDWLQERYSYITATDVAKVLGLFPSCSRQKLFVSKVTQTPDLDVSNPVTLRLVTQGKDWEVIAQSTFETWAETYYYGMWLGGEVPGLIKDSSLDWLAGTPDWIGSVRVNGTESPVVGEFKCHFWPDITSANPISDRRSIPIHYYLQVQTYLHLTKAQFGFLWSWTLENGTCGYVISYDSDLWQWMEPLLHIFWAEYMDARRSAKDEQVVPISRSQRMRPGEAMANRAIVMESLERHTTQVKQPK